ncbi:MAG: glycosyltransferase family 4 protein [Alphaproteobacteria bacterium]
MIWVITAATGLFCFLASLWSCGLVRRWLLRRAVLDRPNARSSHETPVPRGGGLAVMAPLVLVWLAWAVAGPMPLELALVPVLAALLAAFSFVDDLRGLPAWSRLLAQAVAVAPMLLLLPPEMALFQGLLPFPVDRILMGLAWLWFINLTNFMDGIDGISAVEAGTIGLGLLIALALIGLYMEVLAPFAAAILGVALGFLYWNRPPARLFLGDVGSIGLGYLIGFLLIALAAAGYWQVALILPAYYLADATITLGRRALKGEKVWRAHREHFYQRAARAMGGHLPVLRVIGCLNLLLVACAAYAAACPGKEWRALAFAAVGVAVVLWYFGTADKRAGHDGRTS